jgi:hypothetical protein
MHDTQITYSTHVSTLIPDRNYDIQTYTDITITTGLTDKPEFNYDGHAYIVMSDLPPHQHFVRDILGQYFIVSDYFSELAMFMLDERDKTYDEAVKLSYKTILETNCNLSPDSYINLSNYSRVYFKSISYITNDSVPILERHLGEYRISSPVLRPASTNLLLDSHSQLNNKLASYKLPKAATKKIFVSRKKEDKMVENILDSFYEYLKFGLQGVTSDKKLMEDVDKTITNSFFDPENMHRERYNSILNHEFKYAAERLLVQSEHEELETFFSSLGYEIVDASKYTLSEQISIFSQATDVVGIAGGGLVNCMFCDPSAKIRVLAPSNTFYSGGYDQIFSRVARDFFVAPNEERNWQTMEPNRKYSASQIIEAFSATITTPNL